jgi:hypothetical protein
MATVQMHFAHRVSSICDLIVLKGYLAAARFIDDFANLVSFSSVSFSSSRVV